MDFFSNFALFSLPHSRTAVSVGAVYGSEEFRGVGGQQDHGLFCFEKPQFAVDEKQFAGRGLFRQRQNGLSAAAAQVTEYPAVPAGTAQKFFRREKEFCVIENKRMTSLNALRCR